MAAASGSPRSEEKKNLPATPEDRRAWGAIGGYVGWSRTEDRRARMAQVQGRSPSDLRWHAAKLGIADPDDLTEEERRRAESARQAYFRRLARKSADTRRRRKEKARADVAARLDALVYEVGQGATHRDCGDVR